MLLRSLTGFAAALLLSGCILSLANLSVLSR